MSLLLSASGDSKHSPRPQATALRRAHTCMRTYTPMYTHSHTHTHRDLLKCTHPKSHGLTSLHGCHRTATKVATQQRRASLPNGRHSPRNTCHLRSPFPSIPSAHPCRMLLHALMCVFGSKADCTTPCVSCMRHSVKAEAVTCVAEPRSCAQSTSRDYHCVPAMFVSPVAVPTPRKVLPLLFSF